MTSAMMVSWNGLYMASLVKKLFVMFLVCHDHRQIVTNHCDSFQRDPWKCRPGSSGSRHQGQLAKKSAEKGRVVWEESAEISGPRRRAWRKLPQLVMTRSVAVDSSHTMWGFPGRKNVRTFWSCVLTSLAPGMTNNASSRAAKADGFSTGPWLGCGSDWGQTDH